MKLLTHGHQAGSDGVRTGSQAAAPFPKHHVASWGRSSAVIMNRLSCACSHVARDTHCIRILNAALNKYLHMN